MRGALRHALTWAARAQAAGAGLLLALTLGWTALRGALPEALTAMAPGLASAPPLAAALGLFAAGLAALTGLAWALALLLGRRA